jgi:hypothetical protein
VRDFHFDQLQRLLVPQHVRFLTWLILQPPREGEREGEGGGQQPGKLPTLWSHLCTEIGLTVEQGERLQGQLRRVLLEPEVSWKAGKLGETVAYLAKLREVVSHAAATAQGKLEAVRAILTPAQLIRFSAWTEANHARIAKALLLQAAF